MYEGKFAMKSRRLLTSSPKKILSYSSKELFEAIRMSEGRTIVAIARTRGPNICDGVSNAEMCAAFGADIVVIGLYDPRNPYIPGLPSKEAKEPDDTILSQVQADLGRGWTLGEVRELIGRPVSSTLFGTKETFVDEMEASFTRVVATKENARLLIEQGADIIQIVDWLGDLEKITDTIKGIRDEIQDEAILQFGRPHGTGLFGRQVRKDLITENEIGGVIEAGADIVGIPAVGTFPGCTLEYVSKLVSRIHDGGALANLSIATSQEGTDLETIRRIGFYSKMAGADMYSISDAGLSEAMATPENIMVLSIVVKGMRHTYRRMAISPLR